MLIRFATEDDIPSWVVLAKHVSPIFRAPEMATDEAFHTYMHSKVSKSEALIAVDIKTGNCQGIIGFSKTHNRITWFGVYEMYRRTGIGSHLLESALNELDRTQNITVETFREGYEPGEPARHLYSKYGFVNLDNNLVDVLGNPICQMVLKPKIIHPTKLLIEITHKDLGLEYSEDEVKYAIRKASRAVLVNDKKEVAILYVSKGNYYKLPGGGLESRENLHEALKREIQEEVGANIEVLGGIGITLEYREDFEQLQISYGYLCKVIGEVHLPSFTYDEIENGFDLQWMPIEEARYKVAGYEGNKYMAKFVSKRDSEILKEAAFRLVWMQQGERRQNH